MEKADQQVSKIDGGEGDAQEESMEELQAKLAKLKEVISFFISSVSSSVDCTGFPGSKPRYLRNGSIVRSIRRVHPPTVAWTRAG